MKITKSKLPPVGRTLITNYLSPLVVVDKFTIANNVALSRATFSHTCDGIQECQVSLNYTTFVKIEKLLVYFKLFLAENENDREFKRKMVETVADVEKLLKGIYSNPLLQVIIKDLIDKKKLDFDFRLPLKPRTNRVTNISIYDQLVPVFSTTRFRMIHRYVGKVEGNQKPTLLTNMEFIGALLR